MEIQFLKALKNKSCQGITMIIEIVRPILSEEELKKRLSEIRRIAGLIVKDIEQSTYREESNI